MDELNWLFSLCHILFIWVGVLIVYKVKWIPGWLSFALAVTAILPLLSNELLFPPTYMPDQFRYLEVVEAIRSLTIPEERSRTVLFGGLLMAITPVPWVSDLVCLGFINRFVVTALIIWFYRKGYITGLPLLFLLFYPDLLLYSSLGLRDIFVLAFMLVGVALMIQGRLLASLLLLSPLYVLKFQNYMLIMMTWFAYMLLIDGRFARFKYGELFLLETQISLKQAVTLILPILIVLAFTVLFYLPEVIERLNYYRYEMLLENGQGSQFILLEGFWHAVQLALIGAVYFLVMPLPFEVSNDFQMLQSVINLIVLCFLCIFSVVCFKQNKQKTLFWLLFLFFSMAVYSLVVTNYGTAARYRFPFVTVYIFAVGLDVRPKIIWFIDQYKLCQKAVMGSPL